MRCSIDELGETYPRLYNLFGAYFTEDWVSMYGDSPQAAINDFKCALDTAEISEAIAEIDLLLPNTDNADLAKVIDRLGNCYYYENGGFTARTWLIKIRKQLQT